MIIVGSAALERIDGEDLLSSIKTIVANGGLLKPELKWNGFNVLHRDLGRINALEVGIKPKTSANPPKVVIMLGSDNNLDSSIIPKDAFVIYIGHHGDEGAYYADLILPSAAYTEKDGTHVSTEGRV